MSYTLTEFTDVLFSIIEPLKQPLLILFLVSLLFSFTLQLGRILHTRSMRPPRRPASIVAHTAPGAIVATVANPRNLSGVIVAWVLACITGLVLTMVRRKVKPE